MRLTEMVNIGNYAEDKLQRVGITSAEELIDAGSFEAFKRVRSIDPGACLSMFSALEGAIRGVRWHELPPEVKKRLKSEYDSLKGV